MVSPRASTFQALWADHAERVAGFACTALASRAARCHATAIEICDARRLLQLKQLPFDRAQATPTLPQVCSPPARGSRPPRGFRQKLPHIPGPALEALVGRVQREAFQEGSLRLLKALQVEQRASLRPGSPCSACCLPAGAFTALGKFTCSLEKPQLRNSSQMCKQRHALGLCSRKWEGHQEGQQIPKNAAPNSPITCG